MIKLLLCKHATLFQRYLDTKTTNSKPSKRKSECLDEAELKLKQPKLSFLDNSEHLNKTIDTSIVNFIAETGSAFRIVETDSFRKLMETANKYIEVKSARTYSRMVAVEANQVQRDIRAIVQVVLPDLSNISVTSDIWASRAGDSFICLTLHFICKEWG